MILQALTDQYEALVKEKKIAPPGWSSGNISFALCLGDAGELERVICVKTEQPRGKKTVLAPQSVKDLPAPVKRSSGIAANFLWDNSGYLLGVDNKGKPQRSRDCFMNSRALHEKLLKEVDSPTARAILAYFGSWEPEKAMVHPALQEYLEEILSGANLLFFHNGNYVHEDPDIRQAWQRHYDKAGEGPEMVCLVTGELCPAESVHPPVKGLAGAQSSGAALVSFNAPAYCSYGKEQNLNAPVGKYAAFAYTAALNYMLADRAHLCRVGDTTVLCWAKGNKAGYQDAFLAYFMGGPAGSVAYSQGDVQKMMAALCSGEPVVFDENKLDPEQPFYILGLAPNSARLSVRFFLVNTFGAFLRSVQAHQQRLEIVRPAYDKFETLPLWKLLDETVNPNSKEKAVAPELAGETLMAVLNNTPYPATLLNGVTLRIRAEHEMTRGRAAIIKAYYLKKPHKDIPEEVLTVSLNPDSNSVPYQLGRLFSILEALQAAANPGINATIKDKYFNSASATPGHVFPVLINLSQKHMKKLEGGLRGYYEKQISEVVSRLGETYPARLNLPQQGAFQLGYYHQTQARYEKKEEK